MSAPGSAASASRAASTARCAASASSLRPTLLGQLGQLEVRLRQRPPRGEVRLLAQERAELAVKIRRRLQEPVAQILELLFLEQKVFAHAGVECLDRIDGQIIAGLDLGVGGRQISVRFLFRGRVIPQVASWHAPP